MRCREGGGAPAPSPGHSGGKRREVRVGGKRVKTVDAHCHVNVPACPHIIKGTPLERAGGGGAGVGGPEATCWDPIASL